MARRPPLCLARLRRDAIYANGGLRCCGGDASQRSEALRNPTHDTGQIQHPQQDKHQGNAKLHGQSETRRYHDTEDNNCRSHQKNRQCVSQSPEQANRRRASDGALAAHNGGHCNDVVGVRGMTHSQEQSQQNYCHERNQSVGRKMSTPDVDRCDSRCRYSQTQRHHECRRQKGKIAEGRVAGSHPRKHHAFGIDHGKADDHQHSCQSKTKRGNQK